MMLKSAVMAPVRDHKRVGARRCLGDGPRLFRKNDLFARQDKGPDGADDTGRRRFPFGKGNNGNGGDDNADDSKTSGGNSRFGKGNTGNGGGDNADDSETSGGNSRFGGSKNNGSAGDDDNERGRGRFGFGRFRNGNNEDNNTESKPANSADPSTPPKTKTSSERIPAPTPPSEPTTSSERTPEPTTSPEPAQSVEVSVSVTTEVFSTFNPGVILLQSAVAPAPTAEVSVAAC